MNRFFYGPNTKFLTEDQVRYAAEQSFNNSEAARFLKISTDTWKRYASVFIEGSTQLSYYEYLRQKKRVKVRKPNPAKSSILIQDIFNGKHPNYDLNKFVNRIIDEGYKLAECEMCGCHERRLTDKKLPLTVTFVDGNKKNKSLDNVQILCLNCNFLFND